MKKIITLFALLSFTAYGQQAKQNKNLELDADNKMCVNDGGVETCLTINGSTSDITIPNNFIMKGVAVIEADTNGGADYPVQIENLSDTKHADFGAYGMDSNISYTFTTPITHFTGNVGIRDPSPSEDLKVFDGSGSAIVRVESTNSVAEIYIESAESSDTRIRFHEGGNEDALIQHDVSTNQFEIAFNEGAITASDGVHLTSAGNAWLSNSDERLKENWVEDEGALQKILDWRVGEYNYKDNVNKKQFGVIAQDIIKDYPLITDTDPNGYHSVSYSKIGAVLVKAIQEQQAQIEELKKQINELK